MNQNPYRPPDARDEPVSFERHQQLTIKRLIFSFQGRIGRGAYWGGKLLSLLFLAPVAVVALSLDGDGEDPSGALTGLVVVAILLMVVSAWVSIAVSVKRWHDRNKPGLWVLIMFVPYVGSIWELIECGLLPGTPGPNRFGPDPRGSRGAPVALSSSYSP